ncbi:unnamed protein product, partial [Anisakis simplex]|uniref:Protein kinase n=1 Tax=Anisakis simplex TaxID=6269 RepID=A0A0M3J8M3_ANISI
MGDRPPVARHRNVLDPNEDPVSGLERVSSITNLNDEERRQRRLAEERNLREQ